jgi:protoporphyrinogen oxidase
MKIAIVGAGIAGLSAAYRLSKQGHQITIFEAAGYVGGLAAGFKESHWDWSVERFYHHWFQSDSAILGLIEELGWSDQVLFPRPVTVMFHKDKFYPFDSIPSALLYPGLGWGINKARFGLVNLAIRFTNNWQALEKFSVDEWMRKYAGVKAYEAVWEPMVIGKFGERYARQVNMAWMWARLKARTPRLGTFTGGFQAFSDRLAAYLTGELGVQLHLNTPVSLIRQSADPGLSITSSRGEEQFDQCLVTSSPSLLARMAPDLPDQYLNGLLNLKSLGAVVLTLAVKKQLSKEGYYWFNLPKKAGFPFLALVEHTNYLSSDYFGGDHILYCGDYLETDHEYFQLSQEEIIQRFTPSLQRINPDFKPDWIKNAWLYRTQYAQPVPFVNHSKNIPDIRTPIPGLFFASMSQVYPWDRGTNFAVEIAQKAVNIMTKADKQE